MTGGFPIGRQPLRAGMHRPLHHCGTRNINYTKVTYNNFGGGMGMYPMGGMYGMYDMYGGYDTGMSKGEKWMLGIGGAATLIGAIASAFGGNDEEKVGGEGRSETSEANLTPEQQKWIDDTNKKMQDMQKSLDTLAAENRGLKAQQAQIEALKAASQRHEEGKVDTQKAGAEQLNPTTATTTYQVRGARGMNQIYTGDTGYNIVAGLYKSEDGTPLTHSQIMKISEKIFEGKPLKVGDIQLPNSVEVDGKTYNLDTEKTKTPEDMHKNVVQTNYTLGDFKQAYTGSAAQVDGKWVPTIDGKQIEGAAQYDTEQEAKDAAQKAINEKKAADAGE